jgi:hypothetical protein
MQDFLFYIESRLALVPTQPPIHWVLEVLSPGLSEIVILCKSIARKWIVKNNESTLTRFSLE